ncbi:hypothetical protein ABPG72_004363 [Tetrahymena utriculariae]
MDLRQQEFTDKELQMILQNQKHQQNKELQQCRATKEQMVQKIIQEGRMNQHFPLHHRYPVQQQQQYQIYGQQNIQINDNQMHHYNQYQINRNHHLSNLNSLSQKDASQTMMIRRFERKQISKSCDDAIKRQNYHNSYDDEEDPDCNDIYQTDNQEIQKQQYHVYLPQNELQYQNCDDMEGHDEDEEQIEYDENEEFDCQQNLQIQFCNKRDYYNHYEKKNFQQNNGATEDDQEYEEEDDGDDDEDEDEDEEEEEEEEENDHEEFENGDFRGSYTYDEDNQNLRFTNILQKNLNELQQAKNEQLLNQLEKKQILQGNRQQQQLQIKQYQKQLQNQQLQQYILEQQQLQNAQQGKSKQSNLSHQQQQVLQQKQILQQQQIFNQTPLQQLQQKQQINQNIQQLNKNYAPSQQMQQHQYINQNNSYYANGSQNNTVNQNTSANYQNQSQQQKNRGCKTPSTDDNSESFNHSARTNSFQKNTKQSSQSLKKSSVERVAIYGKPKSESEKKLTPSQNSFINQEANLALLSQQKFKYLKDEHLDLDQILNKIYFEEYTYDELKEFVIPALREIQNINNFFDILFNSIRIYAEDVKQKIINNIKQINQACSGIAESQNRIFEVQEFEQIINKHFHKQSEAFIRITNQIYGQYQAVEKYSKQTEKIVYLYINHFIEKNRSIRFNCEDLHRRIFIFFVFADPQINNYLEAKINYFRQKGLNGSKYQDCFHQLNKMHEILIRKNQYIPSEEHPINIEIYEKETCDEEEEEEEEESQNDDRFYQGQPHISQQSTMNQKLLKKRNQKKSKNMQLKKLQQQFAQSQYNEISDQIGKTEYTEQINGLCEYINRLDDSEIKKKKKKKKKNKSAANKDDEQNQAQLQNGEDEQPRDSSTEKIKKSEGKKKGPNCHMNEELEQFQRRLEESFRNLKEHQKIQPIIAENWISKIKERYAKLKVRLNK